MASIRTTHKVGKGTYISKSWHWNSKDGLIVNIFKLIFWLYYALFMLLAIPVKWIINKVKEKKKNNYE